MKVFSKSSSIVLAASGFQKSQLEAQVQVAVDDNQESLEATEEYSEVEITASNGTEDECCADEYVPNNVSEFDDNIGNQIEQTEEAYTDENTYESSEEITEDEEPVSNEIVIRLSFSLINQLKQVSRSEGVPLDDYIIELLSEGITKRAFEMCNRAQPSHLMTRTGYVPPEFENYQAPRLSHHNSMGNNTQSTQQGSNNYRQNNQRRFQNYRNGYNNNYQNGSNNSGGRYNRNNNNGNGNQRSRFEQRPRRESNRD